MGQIFNACAYDIDTKICCVMDADKFHANCYAYSGTVMSIHYMLRQKPHRVMWGGMYVALNNRLANFDRPDDLLGISTDYDYFNTNNDNIQDKSYYDKVKFICDNSNLWERIDVWDEAAEYFDRNNTYSVKLDTC